MTETAEHLHVWFAVWTGPGLQKTESCLMLETEMDFLYME